MEGIVMKSFAFAALAVGSLVAASLGLVCTGSGGPVGPRHGAGHGELAAGQRLSGHRQ